jgi:hypothetical protein
MFFRVITLKNVGSIDIYNRLASSGSSANPIKLFYRIENTITSIPSGTGNLSSAWINGNSYFINELSTGNYYIPSVYNDSNIPDGLPDNQVTKVGNDLVFNLRLYNLQIHNNENINLYCRVGLPMRVACSFSHVLAYIN